ncbi:stalk domain-containing protein [Petroclostridium sp. X23]|uniref:stalk domain-containing protein n=1 Tax=Petroclostridium sp. X23 TaxID=3045146 RepID=UPI0024AD37D6|nr:stalk domain-containing protein [Petroclostridium sp. X23]WHH59949.1 stalk domain-containing protein [Petroclostridium sp. X23]
MVASKHTAIMEHGEIFIALPIVTKYIVPETYWNSNDGKIVLAVKDKIIQLQTNKSIAVIGAESVELGSTPKVVENVPYIPMQFLAKMLDIKIDWAGVNNVVIVDYMKSKKQLAQVVSANAEIRTSPSIKSPILVSYGLKGQVVRVFDEYKKWYKVRTRDGVIGYIDKRYIKSIENY